MLVSLKNLTSDRVVPQLKERVRDYVEEKAMMYTLRKQEQRI